MDKNIKNDQAFMEYLDKKKYMMLTGKDLIQTLKDDYNDFCDEKDEICFEDWCAYKEDEIKEDVLYVIDSDITVPEEATCVKKRYDNAKKLIMDFLNEEYKDESKESYHVTHKNMCMINNYPEKIYVAHTTTEDGEHDIDVSIDLINNKVIRYLDGEEIKIRQYNNLIQLTNNQLMCLDFDELIGQHEVEKYLEDIKEKNKTKNFEKKGFEKNELIENFYKRLLNTDTNEKKDFDIANNLYEDVLTWYELKDSEHEKSSNNELIDKINENLTRRLENLIYDYDPHNYLDNSNSVSPIVDIIREEEVQAIKKLIENDDKVVLTMISNIRDEEEKFMLSKGDEIKTPLSGTTIVLEVQGDDALLFNGNQFVKANGYYEHGGEVEWHYGNYFDKLPNRGDVFPEKKSFEETREELNRIMSDNYGDFVKSLISLEKNIQDEETLNKIYDNYMETDYMNLINEQFDDLEAEVTNGNIIETNKEMEL